MHAHCFALSVCRSGPRRNAKKIWRNMSTTAKRVKDAKKPKFSSRKHNRCQLCGRPRAFLRKFGVCRLCFRQLALKGEIPGVVKSSW
jgi:small subunit ribosomal protein S14